MSKRRSGLSNDHRRYKCSCKLDNINIVNGPGSIYYGDLTQIIIPGDLYDSGGPQFNVLDDGDVPIPMSNIVFSKFFRVFNS